MAGMCMFSQGILNMDQRFDFNPHDENSTISSCLREGRDEARVPKAAAENEPLPWVTDYFVTSHRNAPLHGFARVHAEC